MKPLIILGAPRSGTNILRNTICSSKSFLTWDCDEINYIWRYGSCFKNNDELKVSDLTYNKINYIRNCFKNIEKEVKNGKKIIVEKTCANCLRVEYIYKIIPEASFIYIKRNPFDSIYSIEQRWKGKVSKNYLYKKAKYIPKRDLTYYALRYLSHIVSRRLNSKGELPTWGPRFDGIDKYRLNHTLIETCAKQWLECTTKAEKSIESLKQKGVKVFSVKYENFVSKPNEFLNDLNSTFNLNNENVFDYKNVNNNSIGKGIDNLSKEEKVLIEKIIKR